MFAKIVARIKDRRGDAVVQTAAAAIPEELRATALAGVFDLMLPDGRASRNERRFASELQVLLDIHDEAAARIMDLITLKNTG